MYFHILRFYLSFTFTVAYSACGRPGTYRKPATTDLTSKDSAATSKYPQTGPGQGGPGQTTQKFVPGSKGGVQQPVDNDELPIGDETLPWRQKDKPQKVVGVEEQKPQQALPWTQQQITLKKTQKQTKEIVKEQIEDVQLKPSKPQTREIARAELEQVDLKHRTKVVSTGQKTEEVTSWDSRLDTEDTAVLTVDERSRSEKTESVQIRDWRRPKPGATQETEDTTLLSIEEKERIDQRKDTEKPKKLKLKVGADLEKKIQV
ncbi:hypothetical protein GEV33_000245 [Tenebrio molitor]|uniref:Uncharacterized protein n=1 Tax=Tenebrio molitor TaxID=7067 RepID=A0A8J6LR45_TENMO|nr:hypothetical protein GEV33_000245 [Tenebrio molitor]